MGTSYKCKNCEYLRESRKKLGTPAFCPRCKSHNISSDFEEDVENTNTEIIVKDAVIREQGFIYLIDNKVKILKSDAISGKTIKRKGGIKREKGYLYFINNNGDICRSRM